MSEMSEEHQHALGPHRCCEDEPPAAVVAKLRANPPQRQGYPTLHGTQWNGESPENFARRVEAYEQALAREEAMARAGIGLRQYAAAVEAEERARKREAGG